MEASEAKYKEKDKKGEAWRGAGEEQAAKKKGKSKRTKGTERSP